MLEWLVALILALPLAAALWIGLAILFGQANGEAHEPRTSGIALTASAGAFAAIAPAHRRPAGRNSCPNRSPSAAGWSAATTGST